MAATSSPPHEVCHLLEVTPPIPFNVAGHIKWGGYNGVAGHTNAKGGFVLWQLMWVNASSSSFASSSSLLLLPWGFMEGEGV